MWLWEFLRAPMGLPLAFVALALALLVVGVAGHVVGLWDLNGPRGAGAGRPAPLDERPEPPAAPRRRELPPVHAPSKRLDREEDAA